MDNRFQTICDVLEWHINGLVGFHPGIVVNIGDDVDTVYPMGVRDKT